MMKHDATESCTDKRYIQIPSSSNGVSVREYEKFITVVSDSMLQLTYEKFTKMYCEVKIEYGFPTIAYPESWIM